MLTSLSGISGRGHEDKVPAPLPSVEGFRFILFNGHETPSYYRLLSDNLKKFFAECLFGQMSGIYFVIGRMDKINISL